MVSTTHAALSRLGAGEMLQVRDGSGQTLAVFDGLVWVTQDGDHRDAFIAKGGSFTIDRPGLTVVEALADTRLAVLAAASEPHVAEAENADQYLLNDLGVAQRLKRKVA